MLHVDGLETHYGASQVLFGVSLDVSAGEAVTLLGRNGMGKTTTVHSIMGIVRPRAGRVELGGEDLTGHASYRIAQAGIGLVPEGRQVFPNLSTHENLVATAANRGGHRPPWTVEAVYDMFPMLAERRRVMGNLLSGGEQQMLAIGRALMTNPRLLVLDEATEGLAPLVRQVIWSCLRRIKEQGVSILAIDKNVDDLTALADRHYVIEKGRVAWSGSNDEFRADPSLRDRYLGV